VWVLWVRGESVSREGNGGGAALALPHLVAGRAQRRRRGATGSAMRRAAPGVDP
jgi:hypothetical protein